VCVCVCVGVCVLVTIMSPAELAEPFAMPFGVVSELH